ncbi:XdhC family protein [Allokutzneria sp. NRRL B-24872]|uniref:XdhC family protein n=1 Tax=Allokutzneria sp. NRRL B-24872 TaxID=1137961 RepID=UPI000A38C941|nr:XdhC family protein [Allokutzneria sp. NRRL B-24872]
MIEIADSLRAWARAGREFAVATVTATSGSAPRPVGTSMAVDSEGSVIGNVSGGCVDGAVYELCREAIVSGESSTHTFGYSDETAFAVGLTCGGVIEVVVQPSPVLIPEGTAQPRLLIFGALDFAAALTTIGVFLGYRVTVCDARPVFATPERFPGADVVVDWPHRYLDQTTVDGQTAICVLTHDPKFDVPVLTRALRMPVGYVGALGSRRAHAERLELLRANGLSVEELARLRSPVGLDLGGRTAEETALSIAAEIVACRRGGSGLPLSALSGPIHARLDAVVAS